MLGTIIIIMEYENQNHQNQTNQLLKHIVEAINNMFRIAKSGLLKGISSEKNSIAEMLKCLLFIPVVSVHIHICFMYNITLILSIQEFQILS